jgi:hypothetical protein
VAAASEPFPEGLNAVLPFEAPWSVLGRDVLDEHKLPTSFEYAIDLREGVRWSRHGTKHKRSDDGVKRVAREWKLVEGGIGELPGKCLLRAPLLRELLAHMRIGLRENQACEPRREEGEVQSGARTNLEDVTAQAGKQVGSPLLEAGDLARACEPIIQGCDHATQGASPPFGHLANGASAARALAALDPGYLSPAIYELRHGA